MPVSLYGKLPAKRDFIAEGVPRGFLDTFEPWLQGGLAASRLSLGADWQRIYFEAPIWRFHLGPGHCKRALLGAIMPSVDGVGRSFPLVAFATAAPERTFASPLADSQDGWFETLEAFLLSTLDITDFSTVMAAREALSEPDTIALPAVPEQVTWMSGSLAALKSEGRTSPLQIAAQADAHLAMKFSSIWWTTGGLSFPFAAICGRTLPDADTFSGMLSGMRFSPAFSSPRTSLEEF